MPNIFFSIKDKSQGKKKETKFECNLLSGPFFTLFLHQDHDVVLMTHYIDTMLNLMCEKNWSAIQKKILSTKV